RRAAAARQDRDPEPGGDLERGLDVVGVARDDDAHGFDLVHGGVGRVEEARSWIEADVSADSLAELTLEIVHPDSILGGRVSTDTGTIVAWPAACSPSSCCAPSRAMAKRRPQRRASRGGSSTERPRSIATISWARRASGCASRRPIGSRA